MVAEQTLLSLKPHAKKTFSRFLPAQNKVIVAQLRRLSDPNAETGDTVKQIYLWGTAGSGKSHLLQAACQAASQAGIRSAYLPFSKTVEHGTQILAGLENVSLLCLDDLDAVLAHREWQIALFNLLNAIHARDGRLAMAGENNPLHLNLALKDLHSRLVWGLVYGMQPLSDEEKYLALCNLSKQEDSTLNEETIRYLINNHSRDLRHLIDLAELLDTRAKQEKKNKITIPFIKEILK